MPPPDNIREKSGRKMPVLRKEPPDSIAPMLFCSRLPGFSTPMPPSLEYAFVSFYLLKGCFFYF
jgi:hypothetical protein